jgi:cell division protein FtsI/penicillin-binding protein 2
VPAVDDQGVAIEDPFAQYHTLLTRLLKKDDPYEPIQRGVREDILARIDEAKLPGIYHVDELSRSYPEQGMGGQLLGFLGMNDSGDRVGLYGIEGYHEEFLKGKNGYLASVTDPSGQWIGVGGRAFERAQDGGDLLLTVDRTIQYEACESIKKGVADTQSDSGSITIMEPETGRIIAMCAYPNFEPLEYANVESARTFQNPSVALAYEPGSVMKPLVMAAALDKKSISPSTTYTDSGEEKIDKYTIRNSDLKANGLQTMTQVLEKSLNTGMIYVMRRLGFDSFQSYVQQFGFGERTGIELAGEVTGTIDALDIQSEIYYATASFGQGITVTPIQLATAYSAIANGGFLMRPYIVEEKRYSTGVVETTHPKVVRQVLSEHAAQQAAAMMVSVVENGHAHTAAIPAYYIAGKTGTAQVPKDDGPGYRLDTSRATFAGFAPLDNHQFTMIVMLDHPRTSQWADATASPIWKHMAEFMLQYFEVTPERTI